MGIDKAHAIGGGSGACKELAESNSGGPGLKACGRKRLDGLALRDGADAFGQTLAPTYPFIRGRRHKQPPRHDEADHSANTLAPTVAACGSFDVRPDIAAKPLREDARNFAKARAQRAAPG
jgi:hypothetical protein